MSQMVELTCKNHLNLRWLCKAIAFSDESGYNGTRGIFYQGDVSDPVKWVPECSCSAKELVKLPAGAQSCCKEAPNES